MSSKHRFVKKGFTLVEILIVVVILGILAAIVIPQFTSASESAKGSSLQSQLQTIRSQLELYQVQHNGNYPDLVTDWTQLTGKTDVAGDASVATDAFGPYLQQAPKNPFTNKAVVAADGSGDWSYTQATGVIKPVLSLAQATSLGLEVGQYTLKVDAGGDDD